MKILKSMLAIVLLLTMVSCEENDTPVMTTVREYYSCFNLVENTASSSRLINDAPTYVITQDFVSGKAVVEIKNVKFAEKMPLINMRLEGLKFTINSTTRTQEVTGTNIVPLVDGTPMENYIVNNFRCEVTEYGLNYLPNINITFVVNQVFRVTAIPTLSYFYGNTTIVNKENESEFATKNPVYEVQIDPKTMMADLKINKAQFAQAMPALDMTFGKIPVIATSTGYELECESLIPTVGKDPYPAYEITKLIGVVSLKTGMKLKFDCMGQYSVSAELTYAPAE